MKPKKVVLPNQTIGNFLRTLADTLEAVTPPILEIKSISIKLIHKIKTDGIYNYTADVKSLKKLPALPVKKGQNTAVKMMEPQNPVESFDPTYEHREDCPWTRVG